MARIEKHQGLVGQALGEPQHIIGRQIEDGGRRSLRLYKRAERVYGVLRLRQGLADEAQLQAPRARAGGAVLYRQLGRRERRSVLRPV